MVIWGASTESFHGDGGVYDVRSNVWREIALEGAPAPRIHHSAVWSGKVLIIWGGYEAEGYLADGACYEPKQGKWRLINQVNAPSARELVTAFWSGDKMIIWGGRAADDYLFDGAMYDPSIDQWVTINTNGAPRGRCFTQLSGPVGIRLCGGGFGWEVPPRTRDSYLGDGAIYSPETGEWSPMSRIGAPTARWRHSTVWRWLFWGGAGVEGSFLPNGGMYDPEANEWTVISEIDATSARFDHTTIWTGQEMIVWGGQFIDWIGHSSDGASYVPNSKPGFR